CPYRALLSIQMEKAIDAVTTVNDRTLRVPSSQNFAPGALLRPRIVVHRLLNDQTFRFLNLSLAVLAIRPSGMSLGRIFSIFRQTDDRPGCSVSVAIVKGGP